MPMIKVRFRQSGRGVPCGLVQDMDWGLKTLTDGATPKAGEDWKGAVADLLDSLMGGN